MSDQPKIRRFLYYKQEILREGERAVDPPLLHVAAGAVFENPWLGKGHVEDVWPVILEVGPVLARELTRRIVDLAGGRHAIAGFGKAVLVGEDGEVEHGSAIVHGPHLGPYFRAVVGGTSPVSFTEARRAPGTTVAIPTGHITQSGTRDYYQAIEVHVSDAPHADEIVVILAGVTGPRPVPRSGDRTTDPDVGLDALIAADGWG